MALLAKLIRSKPLVWVLIVTPALWPAWPLFVTANPSATADPLKLILHHLGFVAALLLAIVLSFTPLRVLFPKSEVALALNRHRRLVGVSAAAYATLHFTTHLLYEGGSSPAAIPAILHTALTKPFQLVGLISLALLLVLAVTSFKPMMRWLGGRRWKNLHRSAYVVAALVCYHQAAARKIFPMQVVWIFGTLAALEALRVAKRLRKVPAPANAPRDRARSQS